METIYFEWDNKKNETNIKKHGISFQEAKTVFYDEDAILFDDPAHSKGEERFLIIGRSSNNNALIVSHCYRSNDSIIRIISARKATNSERKVYERGYK